MPLPRLLVIALGGGIVVGAGARVWQDTREQSRGSVAREAVTSAEASGLTAARKEGIDTPVAPPPGEEKPVRCTVKFSKGSTTNPNKDPNSIMNKLEPGDPSYEPEGESGTGIYDEYRPW